MLVWLYVGRMNVYPSTVIACICRYLLSCPMSDNHIQLNLDWQLINFVWNWCCCLLSPGFGKVIQAFEDPSERSLRHGTGQKVGQTDSNMFTWKAYMAMISGNNVARQATCNLSPRCSFCQQEWRRERPSTQFPSASIHRDPFRRSCHCLDLSRMSSRISLGAASLA